MSGDSPTCPRSIKDRAADFLFSQPPTVVVLSAFLSILIAAIWYGVQDVKALVPGLLRQIQSGYEASEAKHTEQIKLIKDDREAERQWMREVLNNRRVNEKPFAVNP